MSSSRRSGKLLRYFAKKAASSRNGKATVSVYDYDRGGDITDFGQECTEEWIEFIKEGRNGRINYYVGEIIYGRVADDRNYDSIIDFVNNKISLAEVMEAIEDGEQYDFENDQYCFKIQRAINDHLCYIGEYYV